MTAVERITIADEPGAWSALGFDVDGEVCRVGTIDIRFAGSAAGQGILDWELSDVGSLDLDGLASRRAEKDGRAPATAHPNRVTIVDHVVAFTPDLDRTIAALRGADLDLRRIREEPTPAGAPRQAFFRLGESILEVVQQPPEAPRFDPARPARLWGLALVCADFDALGRFGPDRIKGPRPAVQPGRRIATVSRAAGLTVPLAFMSPRPEAAA